MTTSLPRLAFLCCGHLEDGVDALLLGGVDERARVDDDDVGRLGRVHQRVARGLDLAEHQLGVDLVLRTAERHEVDALARGGSSNGGAGRAGCHEERGSLGRETRPVNCERSRPDPVAPRGPMRPPPSRCASMRAAMSEETNYQRLRRRVDAGLHHPITELAIVLLIVVSVVLLVLETIYDPTYAAHDALVLAGDLVTWIFVAEVSLRFWVARKKRRFFRRYWIDILAVLPALRAFRFFRVLRLFRLFRAGTVLSRRVGLFRGVFRGALGELTLLGTLTCVLVVAATAILYIVERDNSPFSSLPDTLWYSVFSLVGGEPIGGEPESTLGRAVTLVLMFGGLTIFGMFIGTISASMVSRLSNRSDAQELDLDEHTQHVVVCGWNASGPTVIRELFGGAGAPVAVVLITELATFPDAIPDDVPRDLLYHVAGDFTKVEVLERANIRKAAVAIVMSDSLTPRSDQDCDARTALAAMTIERLCPGIFTCAELRNRDNDSVLKMVGVDEIVVPEEYGGVILGSVGRNRGLVRVIDEVLSSRYGNSFHKVALPAPWVGREVRDLFVVLKERHDALLVSVEAPRDGKRATLLNPPLDHVLEPGSVLVVIATHPVAL